MIALLKNGLCRKTIFILGSLLLLAQLCFADPSASVQNPVDLIQSTVNALQQEVSAGGPNLANNPSKLYTIIKQTVMPYVSINQMAGLALGQKWRTATPKQQQQFIDEFAQILTKTYANAIITVSNYKITLNPMRSNAWQTAQYISVNGQVTSMSNGQSSNLTYYLERSGNSWLIYDLAIEGVSFLQNYQQQFQSFPDMPSLLAKLNAMNS